MSWWILAFFCFFLGIQNLYQEVNFFKSWARFGHEKLDLLQVCSLLKDFEEILMSGLVPEASLWGRLKGLPEPWGQFTSESLLELRASGSALLPTLQRIRVLAESHQHALEEGRAQSAQALVQALVCASLIPIVGLLLGIFLPELQKNQILWAGCCLGAGVCMSGGVIWVLKISDQARWAGLKESRRSWLLSSQCAGERFLAWLRTGTPQDLAWTKTCEFLAKTDPELAQAWGYSVWTPSDYLPLGKAEELIVGAGSSIKTSVQVSLMEGRPCLDRVETSLRGLREGIQTQIGLELSLVGTRALTPLFLCVAPAILGLLVVALWISTRGSDLQWVSWGE